MSSTTKTETQFRLEDFFKGTFYSTGRIYNRKRDLMREFIVRGHATYRKDTLILEEDFEYSDGDTDHRIWQILCLASGRYEGHTHGLVGKAPVTAPVGTKLNWTYRLKLPVRNLNLTFRFLDNMEMSNNRVINTAQIKWMGLTVLHLEQEFFQGTP